MEVSFFAAFADARRNRPLHVTTLLLMFVLVPLVISFCSLPVSASHHSSVPLPPNGHHQHPSGHHHRAHHHAHHRNAHQHRPSPTSQDDAHVMSTFDHSVDTSPQHPPPSVHPLPSAKKQRSVPQLGPFESPLRRNDHQFGPQAPSQSAIPPHSKSSFPPPVYTV